MMELQCSNSGNHFMQGYLCVIERSFYFYPNFPSNKD
jgi:hypothetical protein